MQARPILILLLLLGLGLGLTPRVKADNGIRVNGASGLHAGNPGNPAISFSITPNAGDVLFLFTNNFQSISDNLSTTFHQRIKQGTSLWEEYATYPLIGAANVTMTPLSYAAGNVVAWFDFSGVDSKIFDPNVPVVGSTNNLDSTCQIGLGYGHPLMGANEIAVAAFTSVTTGPLNPYGNWIRSFSNFAMTVMYKFSDGPNQNASGTWGTNPTCTNNPVYAVADTACGLGCVFQGGQSTPSQPVIQSVQGPGGLPVPPQLQDSHALSFITFIAGIMLLSSLPIQRKVKRRKDSFVG